MNPYHSLRAYSFFILLALVWSLSFIAIRFSVDAFPPIFGAMLRVGLALLSLTIMFLFLKARLYVPFKTAVRLWVLGIIAQGMAFAFLFWGEQYIAPALASIINATVPLWVLLINGLILREKGAFGLKKILGLGLGFGGILTIFAPMIVVDESIMTLLGVLAVCGMALSYAAGAVLYQKFFSDGNQAGFHASVWHQHFGSFAFLLLVSLCFEPIPRISSVTSLALFSIVYLGIFSTALAWMMYNYLITEWGAIRAVSVMYIVPVLAIIWDDLWLHLPIETYQIFGVLFILAGVLFVQKPDPKDIAIKE